MEFNGTFIISAISFIIFTLLMNKILYKPVNEIIEKRNVFFDENKSAILSHNENENKCIVERDNRIKNANQNANEIIITGKERIKSQKNEEIKNKKDEITNKISQTKKELENNKNDIYNNLREDVKSLSNYIASKILGENIDNISIDENRVDEVMKNV